MNATWNTIEEMRRGMSLLLQGNPHFMWQREDGRYYPCRDVNQLSRFEKDIFTGIKTPGFFPIRSDNRTRWGLLDYDGDGLVGAERRLADAHQAFDSLSPKFDESWLEKSSPGRYHVWLLRHEHVPAAELQRILRENAPNCREIFPKQTELSDTGKGMGNCVRFPGRHQFRRSSSELLERAGRIGDEKIILPSAKWLPPSRGEQLISLYAQVTRNMRLTGPEQRFDSMQRIVGRLKGKMLGSDPVGEDIACQIHDRFYNENRTQIQTPIEVSRRYFITWFRKAASCKTEFPDYPTTPEEDARIARLAPVLNVPPERLAATVRLFLSAHKHGKLTGRELFLSLPTISRRLGVSIGSASNYRDACYEVGLVKMLKRGSSVTGKASTYELSPEWES